MLQLSCIADWTSKVKVQAWLFRLPCFDCRSCVLDYGRLHNTTQHNTTLHHHGCLATGALSTLARSAPLEPCITQDLLNNPLKNRFHGPKSEMKSALAPPPRCKVAMPPKDCPGNPEIHLIGGSGSSGTTLLAHLIDGLHDLRSGPEAAVFHHRFLYEPAAFRLGLYQALQNQGRAVDLAINRLNLPLVPCVFFMDRDYYGAPDIVDELALFDSAFSLPALCQFLHDRMARANGITDTFAWVDQTPKNCISAKEFLETVPGGRFIHLLRDGRDTALSLARRYTKEAPGHDEATYLLTGVARWTYDVTMARRASHLPGYLEVRYEDLVKRPVDSLNLILAHLNRPKITQAEFTAHRSPAFERAGERFQGGPKPTWGARPDGPITDQNVGKWRTSLAPKLLEQLLEVKFQIKDDPHQYVFGQLLDEVGYHCND
jgi:hypothetical protein